MVFNSSVRCVPEAEVNLGIFNGSLPEAVTRIYNVMVEFVPLVDSWQDQISRTIVRIHR
jgi:hypothetical protein